MTDRELIQKCIEHWENMRADRKCGEKPESPDCALCERYFKKGCQGCPIREKTGHDLCRGTPYRDAADAFYHGTDEEWNSASTAMIDFLKALPEMKEDV